MQDIEKIKADKRDSKGRFIKGYSGNPTGRNAGRNPINELYDALEEAQKRHDKPFLEHFIERAYINDVVAIALAKKILPDMSSINGLKFEQNNFFSISDEKLIDEATKRGIGLPDSIKGRIGETSQAERN